MEAEKLQREQNQDVIYTTITDPYGFIYITTNLINGRRYVRQKIFSDKKTHTKSWVDYLGSGKILKQAIEKERKENFSREIVYVSYNAEDLNKAEKQYTDFFDAKDNEDWYNLAGGGDVHAGKDNPNYGKSVSKETREKLRQVHLGHKNTPEHNEHIRQAKLGEKNPMYRKHSWNKGRTMSQEQKEKISQNRKGKCLGVNNHNYGKHLSKETKLKMSESLKKVKAKGLSHFNHSAIRCIETQEVFESVTSASKEKHISNISRAASKGLTAGRYHWEYISDEEYLKEKI